MPDSLLLDGVDDKIVFSPGGYNGQLALTVAVVAKVTGDGGTFKKFVGINALDSLFGTNNSSPKRMDYFAGSGAGVTSPTLTVVAADAWALYAYTMPNDTTGRMHKYTWGGGTWTHEAQSTIPADPAVTSITLGASGDSTQFMDANILIAGFWDSELSDANIETLTGGTQAWINLAPDELFRLDRTSTISSLTGSGAETSRTGTTLDVGDAPAGWSDGEETSVLFARLGRGAGW